MRRAICVTLAGLGAALLPSAARATAVHYEVYWGGFHAAEVALASDHGPGGYHATLGIETAGLAERLSGLAVQAEASGRAGGRDTLTPHRFSADTEAKDSDTSLAVQYGGANTPARIIENLTRRLTPDDDDQSPRPPVPPALRVGTLDPLTALVELGRRAADCEAGHGPRRFVLPVYDGRQRYDAHVTVGAAKSVTVHDRRLAGIDVDVTLVPLAGFRADGRQLWSNASFDALIDPVTALPLRIVSKDFTIATVIDAEAPPTP